MTAPWISNDARDEMLLAPLAARSSDATREHPDDDAPLRDPFQRDRDRIIHSKAFRRLMHKTQVFIRPPGDHVRTRLTHTLEVSQIARTIGRALGLNEDLIEAIGMGHDLGHTPFGHVGERALSSVFPGFRHNEQSLRVVDKLEREGRGLNLTLEVRDGILRHSKSRSSLFASVSGVPGTLEGQVMKIADSVAYLNHDLDDAIQARIIDLGDVPRAVRDSLGDRHSLRINTLVDDIVAHSNGISHPGLIAMSPAVGTSANALRDFLFSEVYDPINALPETLRVHQVITTLFDYYVYHPEELPAVVKQESVGDPPERQAADYIASMTDRFALERFDLLTGNGAITAHGTGSVPWHGMP